MNDITLVSGLPRSGTSMMMQMLEAGGFPILTDQQRTADLNNPKGYYEFEKVKRLQKGDIHWVKDATHKAVKVVSALLEFLPMSFSYKVIFMRRHIEEILVSQKQMLRHSGEELPGITDEQLISLYAKHLAKVEAWLSQQSNIKVLHISYNDIVKDPRLHIAQIDGFLGSALDIERMISVIDTILYRNRTIR